MLPENKKRNRMSFSLIESFDLLLNLKAGELDKKHSIINRLCNSTSKK